MATDPVEQPQDSRGGRTTENAADAAPVVLEGAGDAPTSGLGAEASRGRSTVIVLDRVRKRFGDFVAVQMADFAIGAGEFFSMLGPSGCGKTTTLRMIAGFESPTEGRILLDGTDVSKTPPYRRNVNTVFQQYALFPHMSVLDNVAFGPRSKGASKAEAARRGRAVLDTVRMSDFAGRRPAQLSGGQQQRVALARALVNQPRALLLDEPLAALDLKLRQSMQLELKRIQRETGVTFIFVTHDQQEALTMSDRIAVLSDGRVEQIGSPAEIYHRPATAFVAGFIGEANLLPTEVEAVGDGRATVAVEGRTLEVAAQASVSVGDVVMVMLRPERVELGRPDGGSGIDATVREVVFRGPSTRLELVTAGGTTLVSHHTDGTRHHDLRPGDAVTLAWAPDAAYLVAGAPPRAAAVDPVAAPVPPSPQPAPL